MSELRKYKNVSVIVEGCFTYIKDESNNGFSIHKVNTTDEKEALKLYKQNSHRVAFVGSLHWLD